MKVCLAAALALQDVVDRHRSLDDALEKVIAEFDGSVPELRETATGACRFYELIDFCIAGFLKKPIKAKDRIVHFLLAVAIYQLARMNRPDHAVVNECVESLKGLRQKWATNLVNGVLRNIIRRPSRDSLHGIPVSGRQMDNAIRYGMPRRLFDRYSADWPEHYPSILNAFTDRPPLTLRVNVLRNSRDDYAQRLDVEGISYELCLDSPVGITLKTPVGVSEIPGFGEGLVSVQDESAQLISGILEMSPGQRVLDGCAAPGGKTGLLLETEPGLASLTALDVAERVQRIDENLERLGLKAQVIAGSLLDPDGWWSGESFDRILLDVPCSGSGVIRRHPDIKYRRAPGDIRRFAAQQRAMLDSAWAMLGDGGLLVYVTCSVFAEENDGVIANFLQDTPGIELESRMQITGIETRYGIQRLPGVHNGDGFYYSRLKKVSHKN